MSRRKVSRLRDELEQLRAAKYGLKTEDLISFAGRVGRTPNRNRGKEPTYVNYRFPSLNPLSIPGHKTINAFTANSILDTLEADLDRWEDHLDEEEQEQASKTDKQQPRDEHHGISKNKTR